MVVVECFGNFEYDWEKVLGSTKTGGNETNQYRSGII
jgi:hypothetical protein